MTNRPKILKGQTYAILTGYGTLYVTVNELNNKPYEIFATIGKSGQSLYAKTEAIGRLATLCLKQGVEIRDIIDQLKGIVGDKPQATGSIVVNSIPDAIGIVLEEIYSKEVT